MSDYEIADEIVAFAAEKLLDNYTIEDIASGTVDLSLYPEPIQEVLFKTLNYITNGNLQQSRSNRDGRQYDNQGNAESNLGNVQRGVEKEPEQKDAIGKVEDTEQFSRRKSAVLPERIEHPTTKPDSQPEYAGDFLKDVRFSKKKKETEPKSPAFLNRIFTEIDNFRKKIIDLPDFNEFKKTINNWNAEMQMTAIKARNINAEFKKAIPEPDTRRAVNVWIESGGDVDKIKQWEALTNDKTLKKDYTNALNLTDKDKEYAKKASDIYDFFQKKGEALGILDNAVENYVNRLINTEPKEDGKPTLGSAKLMKSFRAQKKRTFPTIFDAEQAGYKTVSKDIADLLSLYISEFGKTVATKEFIKDLSNSKATDGRPLAIPSGVGIPIKKGSGETAKVLVIPLAKTGDYSDYKGLNHYSLTKWK